jgi:hypothetical protein
MGVSIGVSACEFPRKTGDFCRFKPCSAHHPSLFARRHLASTITRFAFSLAPRGGQPDGVLTPYTAKATHVYAGSDGLTPQKPHASRFGKRIVSAKAIPFYFYDPIFLTQTLPIIARQAIEEI